MDSYCSENGFIGWYETSEKEDINIEVASKCLVRKVNYAMAELLLPNVSALDDPIHWLFQSLLE